MNSGFWIYLGLCFPETALDGKRKQLFIPLGLRFCANETVSQHGLLWVLVLKLVLDRYSLGAFACLLFRCALPLRDVLATQASV